MSKPKKPVRTISRKELARLSFVNSRRLCTGDLGIVNDGGVLKEWVGIGWLAIREKPTGKKKYPMVVD